MKNLISSFLENVKTSEKGSCKELNLYASSDQSSKSFLVGHYHGQGNGSNKK